MAELIQEYFERFSENFPLFMVMGMEDEKIEALIRDCLDTGTPYHPDDTDHTTLY